MSFTRRSILRMSIAFFLMSICSSLHLAAGEELLSRIRARAAENHDRWIEIRRQIDMHPEVSGDEIETARLIARTLRQLGLRVQTGIGGHGVIGVLDGGKPGPVVAWRADMDAVRSEVVGDPPYRSKVPGVKHVCGHDAHVAVGLGIADVLASVREDLHGTVKFLFQPAEETVEGARAMIADGAMTGPAPEAIFAVHAAPFPVGSIICPAGVGLTGWMPFSVRVSTEGDLDDLVAGISDDLEDLSTVSPPRDPETFATMVENLLIENGPYEQFIYVSLRGVDSNEDGSSRTIKGAIRADGQKSYDTAMKQVAASARRFGAEDKRIEILFGHDERMPDMHGDPGLVRAAIEPIEAALGEGKAIPMRASVPFFGEDFALFQQQAPGAMFLLGVANREKGIDAFNHFPDYDLDEAAIEVGTVAMANVLIDYLESHP